MEEAPITQEEAEEAKLEEEENDTLKNEEEKETPKTSEPEKTEKSKELQSALAQKEHYRKKYTEALEKMKSLENSDKVSNEMPAPTNPMEVVKLAKALEGYSEDEVDFIVRNASDKSVEGIINITKDEWVQTAIQARREKVANENKTPEPSSPSAVLGDKTPEDIEKMDDKEFAQWIKKNPPMKEGRSGV